MDPFAGLDVSMEEMRICGLDREGPVIREEKPRSSPAAIAACLGAGPPCERAVFETGRRAPVLYHGPVEHGVRGVCLESRQAYPALKARAGHKTDRNDARGLTHLAHRGVYKPTYVKSLSAPAVRSLSAARKKRVGQHVTLDNRIRGLGVVFGLRLPRALSPAFKDAALKVSDGVPGRQAALTGRFDRPLRSTPSQAQSDCRDRCRHQEDGARVQGLFAFEDGSCAIVLDPMVHSMAHSMAHRRSDHVLRCSIPDDRTDRRRRALFGTGSMLIEVRDRGRAC